MIQTRKLFVVASLVAASIAMAAQDGITLRKTLRQGIESYHMESSLKQTVSLPGGAGDQEMGMTSVTAYTYKIGTVDATAGTAPVELSAKVEKFDVDGPLAEAMNSNKDKVLVTTKTNGKLDSRNRFTPDTGKKVDPMAVMLGSASSSLVGPFIEFPEKAVKIGDSWDITIPKSPMTGKEDQKLTATLVSEKAVDGKSLYLVILKGTLKITINMAEIMKDNANADLQALGANDMTISGTIDLNGEANLDKATCQTQSMNIKLLAKQEISVAALGDQKISSSSTGTIKITLDK